MESIRYDFIITNVLRFALTIIKYFTERFGDIRKHWHILQPGIKEIIKFLNIDYSELELIEFMKYGN